MTTPTPYNQSRFYNEVEALQAAGAVPTLVRKTVTFVAGTTGAVGPHDLFTVTGFVKVVGLYAVVDTTMDDAGATADLLIGIDGDTNMFTADGAISGSPTAGSVWEGGNDSAWTDGGLRVGTTEAIIADDEIIYTVGTEAITTGVATFCLLYIPLSAGASVAPA